MPQTFIVDQAATFQAVALLSVEPKLQFGAETQETNKDGVPKWEIQLVAGFKDSFGRVNNEVIKVGIAARKNPGESMNLYTPVQLVNFTVGVMEKTSRDDPTKVIGITVWYRCDDLRPLTAGQQSARKDA
jgi:hypothetical protein